ncbi:metallo-beta-lactamase superfamily protein [Lasiodiplodia theobromae]|nr:metallo-beta-lactamase superfamily protein [Lasiodiplodia theobromae]
MPVHFAIHTCPPIPAAVPSPDPSSPDTGLWSPLSCTLIYTSTTAILIDCPATVAATNELASWIKRTLPPTCTLKHFIATHAHGDHFLGFPVLQQHFPSIVATATAAVIRGIAQQYEPATYDRLWKPAFPPGAPDGTGLPEAAPAVFEPLPTSGELELQDGDDGQHVIVRVHDVPHGDTHANAFVHVPALSLVVAGDIVYNGDCHQWLGEASTQAKRDAWVEALGRIRALRPRVVVAGHTFAPATEADEGVAMGMLEGTEEYIRGFEEEVGKAGRVDELFGAMRVRYQRWNLYLLDGGCRAAMQAK